MNKKKVGSLKKLDIVIYRIRLSDKYNSDPYTPTNKFIWY